jgi:hypothetical protein
MNPKAHTDIKPRPFLIKTEAGDATGDIVAITDFRQVNLYTTPNNGPAMFAMFPNHMDDDEIRAALRPVLEGSPQLPGFNITDQVAGAVAAGTVPVVNEVPADVRILHPYSPIEGACEALQ